MRADRKASCLVPLPSRAELRFKQHYAGTLEHLHEAGVRWEVNPVETAPPDPEQFARLARQVALLGQPWRWVRVFHRDGALLGYLALFPEGTVRDDSGTRLSEVTLLAWSGRELEQLARRITHQNRVNQALNAQTRAHYRMRLPRNRAGAVASVLVTVPAMSLCRAMNEGLLGGGERSGNWLYWLTFAAVVAGAVGCVLFPWRWWQLRRWLGSDN